MKTSEKIDQLLPDLFKVKAAILPLKKVADNPFFKSKYVDLNTILDAVEPLLAANNFILLQPVTGRVVETILLHASGQFVSSDMELVLAKNDMQALGSAVSYARRYSLFSLLGLKGEDDDGNAATFEKPFSVSNMVAKNKKTEAASGPSTVTLADPKGPTVTAASEPKSETKPAAPKSAPFFKPKAAATGGVNKFD